MRVLITGGAGFIGSYVAEALAKRGCSITILDNLATGRRDNLQQLLKDTGNVELRLGDCAKRDDVKRALRDVDTVFHLAANPEVRLELGDPKIWFRQNIYATYILLEEMSESEAERVIFTSTSTVYGDARIIPTPENYSPLEPISIYGASKLASEALISSYCHTYGKKAVILRLANVVGARSTHGVIRDFIAKLRKNPHQLEVLGDGTQTKSYLYVDDCISAILEAGEASENRVEIFNAGSEDYIDVIKMAKIVTEEMRLGKVDFKFTGGVDGGRGWKGDVKTMLLDISRLKSRGWRPKYSSEQAVRCTVQNILRPPLH